MIGRRCGDCTLCCRLLPVKEFGKRSNERCQYQRAKGCSIYRQEGFPLSCSLWSCMWLADESTLNLDRPDRSHYVIDPSPDFIQMDTGGQQFKIPVIQVWIDPKYPKAYEDAKLQAWLAERAECYHQAALIRSSSHDAFILFAPFFTSDGTWRRKDGTSTVEHTAEEIVKTLKLW